jgi:hypothetical protein
MQHDVHTRKGGAMLAEKIDCPPQQTEVFLEPQKLMDEPLAVNDGKSVYFPSVVQKPESISRSPTKILTALPASGQRSDRNVLVCSFAPHGRRTDQERAFGMLTMTRALSKPNQAPWRFYECSTSPHASPGARSTYTWFISSRPPALFEPKLEQRQEELIAR